MDSQQQFCLKWNSFGTNLATTFGNLFKSESLTDVTLFCEGVTFKAHKLILAACSKHFQDLFETAPVCPSVLVILDGTSSSNMSALLEFMYKGEVHVSQESLSSFLKAAECLQVKGLSIEHEKLAVVHSSQTTSTVSHESQLDSPTGRKQPKPNSLSKENLDVNSEQQQQPPMPPQSQHHQQQHASTSYSPALYMHPHHYRYEQRVPASPSHYDAPPPRKRHHRSSSEVMQDAAVRASVLRDGSKSSEMLSPLSLAYRSSVAQQQQQQQSQPQPPPPPPPPELELKVETDNFIQSPHHVRYDTTSESNNTATTVTYDRTAAVDVDNNTGPASSDSRRSSVDPGSSCPEDLRVKLEITGSHTDDQHTNTAPYSDANTEQAPEIIPTNVWNSSASIKMSPHKGSSMSTPDGKKLKCPFCERLYGYETNLRAHIRQRHQGIRVPCPFCSRTFTRNNTVRRHIAREHKTEYSLKVFQQAQVHNHNNQ